MTELMVLVERAVRPVRANGQRKLRMREELLAHLTGIYDEERGRLGDDALALRRAAERFGDPATLAAELQATVPAVERVLGTSVAGPGWEWRAVRWFHPRPGEGGVRHAARVAAVFAGSILAEVGLVAAVQYATGVSWSPVGIDPASAAVVTAHAFVSAMLCVGFFRATSGRLTARSVCVAVACAVPILAGGPVLVAALAAVQPDNPLWGSDLWQTRMRPERLALSGLFGLVGCAIIFRFGFARQRRVMTWMDLKIDG